MIYRKLISLGSALDRGKSNSPLTGFGGISNNNFYPLSKKRVSGDKTFFLVRSPLLPDFVDSLKRKDISFVRFQAKNRAPEIHPFFDSRDIEVSSPLLADLLLIPVKPIRKYYAVDSIPAFVYDDGNVSKTLPVVGIRDNNFVPLNDNPEFIGLKIDDDVKDFTSIFLDFSQSPTTVSDYWIFQDDFETLDNWDVKNGEVSVENGVLTLNNALIGTKTQVFSTAGNLNFKEFDSFTVYGILIELEVLDSSTSISIGYGRYDSNYAERVAVRFSSGGRLELRYYTDRGSLTFQNSLSCEAFKTKDGKYRIYIALYFLGRYEERSYYSYTTYYYGIVRAIATPFLKYLPFFYPIGVPVSSYIDDYIDNYEFLLIPYKYFVYTDILANYRRSSSYGSYYGYLNFLFGSDYELYLFLEGTAKVDSIRIRPILELNRYPYHKKLFNEVSAFQEGEPNPQAIAETQETYSRSNKSFAFIQETSEPIPEFPAGSESSQDVPVKNGKKFIRNFKTSLFVVQPVPYSQQKFRYTQNEFTITITKRGRDSIQLEYEVPLGKFVRVVFPCNMIVGEPPANLKINRNMVEGWIIYDEPITFSVTDEDACVYNVTLKPVNYLERT